MLTWASRVRRTRADLSERTTLGLDVVHRDRMWCVSSAREPVAAGNTASAWESLDLFRKRAVRSVLQWHQFGGETAEEVLESSRSG